MDPRAACLQYFLAGKGHRKLASELLNHFAMFREGVQTGKISRSEKDEMTGRLSNRLYRYYPVRYKEKIKR